MSEIKTANIVNIHGIFGIYTTTPDGRVVEQQGRPGTQDGHHGGGFRFHTYPIMSAIFKGKHHSVTVDAGQCLPGENAVCTETRFSTSFDIGSLPYQEQDYNEEGQLEYNWVEGDWTPSDRIYFKVYIESNSSKIYVFQTPQSFSPRDFLENTGPLELEFFVQPEYLENLPPCEISPNESCRGCPTIFAENYYECSLFYDFNVDSPDEKCEYQNLQFGCLDEQAINYSDTAKIDDGSCEYAKPMISIIPDMDRNRILVGFQYYRYSNIMKRITFDIDYVSLNTSLIPPGQFSMDVGTPLQALVEIKGTNFSILGDMTLPPQTINVDIQAQDIPGNTLPAIFDIRTPIGSGNWALGIPYNDIIKQHFCIKNVKIEFIDEDDNYESCLPEIFKCEFSRQSCDTDADCGTYMVDDSIDYCFSFDNLNAFYDSSGGFRNQSINFPGLSFVYTSLFTNPFYDENPLITEEFIDKYEYVGMCDNFDINNPTLCWTMMLIGEMILKTYPNNNWECELGPTECRAYDIMYTTYIGARTDMSNSGGLALMYQHTGQSYQCFGGGCNLPVEPGMWLRFQLKQLGNLQNIEIDIKGIDFIKPNYLNPVPAPYCINNQGRIMNEYTTEEQCINYGDCIRENRGCFSCQGNDMFYPADQCQNEGDICSCEDDPNGIFALAGTTCEEYLATPAGSCQSTNECPLSCNQCLEYYGYDAYCSLIQCPGIDASPDLFPDECLLSSSQCNQNFIFYNETYEECFPSMRDEEDDTILWNAYEWIVPDEIIYESISQGQGTIHPEQDDIFTSFMPPCKEYYYNTAEFDTNLFNEEFLNKNITGVNFIRRGRKRSNLYDYDSDGINETFVGPLRNFYPGSSFDIGRLSGINLGADIHYQMYYDMCGECVGGITGKKNGNLLDEIGEQNYNNYIQDPLNDNFSYTEDCCLEPNKIVPWYRDIYGISRWGIMQMATSGASEIINSINKYGDRDGYGRTWSSDVKYLCDNREEPLCLGEIDNNGTCIGEHPSGANWYWKTKLSDCPENSFQDCLGNCVSTQFPYGTPAIYDKEYTCCNWDVIDNCGICYGDNTIGPFGEQCNTACGESKNVNLTLNIEDISYHHFEDIPIFGNYCTNDMPNCGVFMVEISNDDIDRLDVTDFYFYVTGIDVFDMKLTTSDFDLVDEFIMYSNFDEETNNTLIGGSSITPYYTINYGSKFYVIIFFSDILYSDNGDVCIENEYAFSGFGEINSNIKSPNCLNFEEIWGCLYSNSSNYNEFATNDCVGDLFQGNTDDNNNPLCISGYCDISCCNINYNFDDCNVLSGSSDCYTEMVYRNGICDGECNWEHSNSAFDCNCVCFGDSYQDENPNPNINEPQCCYPYNGRPPEQQEDECPWQQCPPGYIWSGEPLCTCIIDSTITDYLGNIRIGRFTYDDRTRTSTVVYNNVEGQPATWWSVSIIDRDGLTVETLMGDAVYPQEGDDYLPQTWETVIPDISLSGNYIQGYHTIGWRFQDRFGEISDIVFSDPVYIGEVTDEIDDCIECNLGGESICPIGWECVVDAGGGCCYPSEEVDDNIRSNREPVTLYMSPVYQGEGGMDNYIDIVIIENPIDIVGFQIEFLPPFGEITDNDFQIGQPLGDLGLAYDYGYLTTVDNNMIVSFNMELTPIPAGSVGLLGRYSVNQWPLLDPLVCINESMSMFGTASGDNIPIVVMVDGEPNPCIDLSELFPNWPACFDDSQCADGYICENGTCIDFTDIIFGCTDINACNYNSEAQEDDGSCAYELDCNGVCGGPAELDECGICNGPGASYTCSDGSVVCSFNDCPEVQYEVVRRDYCGVCGGNVYLTTTGGNCDLQNFNLFHCGNPENDDSWIDCNGDCFGEARIGQCGECCGGNTGVTCSYWRSETTFGGLYDCNELCPDDDGYSGSDENYGLDNCGICNGPGKSTYCYDGPSELGGGDGLGCSGTELWLCPDDSLIYPSGPYVDNCLDESDGCLCANTCSLLENGSCVDDCGVCNAIECSGGISYESCIAWNHTCSGCMDSDDSVANYNSDATLDCSGNEWIDSDASDTTCCIYIGDETFSGWLDTYYQEDEYLSGGVDNLDEWLIENHGPGGDGSIPEKLPNVLLEYGRSEFEPIYIHGAYNSWAGTGYIEHQYFLSNSLNYDISLKNDLHNYYLRDETEFPNPDLPFTFNFGDSVGPIFTGVMNDYIQIAEDGTTAYNSGLPVELSPGTLLFCYFGFMYPDQWSVVDGSFNFYDDAVIKPGQSFTFMAVLNEDRFINGFGYFDFSIEHQAVVEQGQ